MSDPVSGMGGVPLSELIPLRSKKVSLWGSRATAPLLFTAAMVVALFSVRLEHWEDIYTYMAYATVFMLGIIFMTLYAYSGERKHILWYAWPVALTYWQLQNTFSCLRQFFRYTLPGDIHAAMPSFWSEFSTYVIGVGIPEEIIKDIPVLIALSAAIYLRRRSEPRTAVRFALEGPIDGLLIGIAAGLAFTYWETLGKFIPAQVQQTAQANHGDLGIGFVAGFMLLLPRIAGTIVGHSAFAGIFGYFAGLALNHPRAMWRLLAIGFVAPVILHSLWDSLGSLIPNTSVEILVGFVTALLLLSCLLKGKQLEVSRLGGHIDGRSILALSPPPGIFGPGDVVPPQAGGLAGVFTRVVSSLEGAAGVTASTTALPAAVVAARGLSIGTASLRYTMVANALVDLTVLFAGVPTGCAALITPAQDGGLDLVNAGAATWSVALPSGALQSIPPSGRLAAQPGSRLLLGLTTITIEIS